LYQPVVVDVLEEDNGVVQVVADAVLEMDVAIVRIKEDTTIGVLDAL